MRATRGFRRRSEAMADRSQLAADILGTLPGVALGGVATSLRLAYPGLLWGMSSELVHFIHFGLCFSLAAFPLGLGSFNLELLQSAIRTRLVSVPGDDAKSVQRNERTPSTIAGSV